MTRRFHQFDHVVKLRLQVLQCRLQQRVPPPHSSLTDSPVNSLPLSPAWRGQGSGFPGIIHFRRNPLGVDPNQAAASPRQTRASPRDHSGGPGPARSIPLGRRGRRTASRRLLATCPAPHVDHSCQGGACCCNEAIALHQKTRKRPNGSLASRDSLCGQSASLLRRVSVPRLVSDPACGPIPPGVSREETL